MKVAYLTLESYQSQPIIKSQVINLFKAIEELDNKTTQNPMLISVLYTFEDIIEDNIDFEHIQVPSLKHIGIKNKGILKNYFHLYKNRRKYFKDVDIIHVRSYLPMVPALIVKFFYRKRVIFDMRGVLPEETKLRKSSTLLYIGLLLLEKIACRFSDKVVVVSKSFKEVVRNRSAAKEENIVVIPTFSVNSVKERNSEMKVPEIRKQMSWDANTPIFVYSGAFEKWQCAEQIISFMEVVHQLIPKARFVVLSKHVNEFLRFLSRDLSKELFYVANAPNENLTDYLSQCNYGLLFRAKTIINQVAAPIKFKDYLSAGIPVIITDGIGDYSGYIRNEELGYILDDMSLKSFNKVVTLLKEQNSNFDRQKIISAADRLFDVRKAAKGYLELYNVLQ